MQPWARQCGAVPAPALSPRSEAAALLVRQRTLPICPAARALRTKATCISACPWGTQGNGSLPMPWPVPLPQRPWHTQQAPHLGSCPSSTLLKPTGETVVRSRLCVVTSLCPGAECSPRPWWEEDPCSGARRSSCQAGGAGRGVPPSLSPALLGRCPSHPDRLQWWVTGSASPAQLQRQVLGRARPSSQPGAPEVRDGAQHPLPRGECYCAG